MGNDGAGRSRREVALGPGRREWHGGGSALPEEAKRVLALARGGRRCKWTGIGRRVGHGYDQVDVERLLWAAVDAGCVIVRERTNRRRDWEPYQWRLTESGEVIVAHKQETPIDVGGFLADADDPNHPVLSAIRGWLERACGSPMATRLVVAIGLELREGRIPRERLLSRRVAGFSKAVRIAYYRAEIEEALGLPMEEVIRKAGDAAVVAGPIRFRVNGIETDARGIPPWLALPTEAVDAIEQLRVEGDRLLTIENLTVFEEEVRRGLEPGTIALYVGGFVGGVERRLLDRLVQAGIRRIDHWGDLDVGGLRILRQVRSLVAVDVHPYRMDPDLLHRIPAQPLTDNDRAALSAWVADSTAPDRPLAEAILASGRKVEQEGWFLLKGLRAAESGFKGAPIDEDARSNQEVDDQL